MTKYLLWTDLEATGLSITEDEVLEAAFILTDTGLTELGRVEAVLEPGPFGLKRLMGNPVVRKMHTDNGLIAAVLSGPTCSLLEVEQRALDLLANNEVTKDDVVHLAGSGIAAFDRPIIRECMPTIDALLHYAPIDVGVLKRTYEMWTGQPITTDEAGKAHRAMADVEGHLREARAFRDLFKRIGDLRAEAAFTEMVKITEELGLYDDGGPVCLPCRNGDHSGHNNWARVCVGCACEVGE